MTCRRACGAQCPMVDGQWSSRKRLRRAAPSAPGEFSDVQSEPRSHARTQETSITKYRSETFAPRSTELTIGHWSLAIATALFLLLTVAVAPATAFNHPELDWRVYETEHFRIYHHDAVTESAARVAEIAEEVYSRLKEAYGRDLPLPVRIVFDDTFDPRNGAAYTAYRVVSIEGLSSSTEFRGTHDWLRDVTTHELAHLFSLGQSTMLGDLVPGLVVSGLDAPYGRDSQVAATLFLPAELTPRWFAEGIAQADSAALAFDRWDSHRDMLLRASVLEDGVFPFAEMAALSNKNYLEAEKVYNQGFGFLLYLNERFGPDTGARIAREAGRTFTTDFRKPMATVLGVDPEVVFAEYIDERRAVYRNWHDAWKPLLFDGEPVTDAGFLTGNVAVSPDGKYLAFTGNGTAEFSAGDLYLYEVETGKRRIVFSGVGSRPAWLPDSSAMIVSSDAEVTLDGYSYHDLFLLTVDGKTTRLTRLARAEDPAVSADGKWVAASVGRDGRRNLTVWPLVDGELGDPRTLTDFSPGVEAAAPAFSPDGARLVFTVNVDQSSDIWALALTDATVTPVTQGPAEDLTPLFLDDETLVYVSDGRKAFDVYTLHLPTRKTTRYTTTVGGAFSPSTDGRRLYYTVYRDGGFGIYRSELDAETKPEDEPLPLPLEEVFARDHAVMTRRFAIEGTTRPYVFDPLPLKFYPEFLVSDGGARAGGTLAFGDVLGKHELELEVLFGQNQDYHLTYQNHQWYPDFIFDVSRYVRRDQLLRGIDETTKLDFTFDAGMVGVWLPLGRSHGLFLSETAKRIDFGYPVDRTMQFAFEHAAEYNHYNLTPNASADINPTGGRTARLRAGYHVVRNFDVPFFGSILDGAWQRERYWSVEGEYTEFVSLPGDTTWEFGVRGGWLSDAVSSFDQLYLGGRIFFLRQGEFQSETGFPGYDDYAVAGEKLLLFHTAYRFPLWQGHAKAGALTADSVYLNLFSHAGNVLPNSASWADFFQRGKVTCPGSRDDCTLSVSETSGLLTDFGAELRMKTLFFDIYPWNSFVRAAYGFHEPRVERRLRLYVGLGIGY